MRKTLILASVLRKCGTESEETMKKKKFDSRLVSSLILAAVFSVLLFFLGIFIAKSPEIIPDPIGIFQTLFFADTIIIIFISIPVIMNQFYMSNDLPVILVMPYKPFEIVNARLINSIGTPLLFSFVLCIPTAIGYGINSYAPVNFFVTAILAFIFIPVISFSFISIIIILIMTVVKIMRNKDFVKIFGIVAVFVIILLFYLFSAFSENLDTQAVTNALNTVNRFSCILPINFALGALMHEFSIISILEIAGISAAFFIVFWITASKLYIKGAMSMQETSGNGKLLSSSDIKRYSRKRSISKAFFIADFTAVRREPAYLMNGFLYTLIFPIIIAVISSAQMGSYDFLYKNMTENPAIVCIFIFQYVLELTCCASSVNSISCTPISRDGQIRDILKQLPISFNDVIKSKHKAAILICSLGSTLYVLVGGSILAFIGYIPFWAIPAALAFNIPLLILIVNSNMIHDFKHPYFAWENEAQMLKKTTGILSMVILILGIMLSVILPVLILFIPTINSALIVAAYLILTALLIAAAIFSTKRMYKAGEDAYSKM